MLDFFQKPEALPPHLPRDVQPIELGTQVELAAKNRAWARRGPLVVHVTEGHSTWPLYHHCRKVSQVTPGELRKLHRNFSKRKDAAGTPFWQFETFLLDTPAFRGADLRCGPRPEGYDGDLAIMFLEISPFPDRSSAHQARGRAGRYGDKTVHLYAERDLGDEKNLSDLDAQFQLSVQKVVNDFDLARTSAAQTRLDNKDRVHRAVLEKWRAEGNTGRCPKRSTQYRTWFKEISESMSLHNLSPPADDAQPREETKKEASKVKVPDLVLPAPLTQPALVGQKHGREGTFLSRPKHALTQATTVTD
jgi:hypothetical protein